MGKFRLTITPAVEKGIESIAFEFSTPEEMIAAKESCSRLLIFIQDDLKVMRDYSNVFDMEEFIGGEWEEFDDWSEES